MSAFEQMEMTEQALVVSDNQIDFETWQESLEQLKRMDRCRLWWIGDLLNFGEAAFGESWAQVLDPDDYSYDTLRKAKWVSKEIPKEARVEGLTWTHHSIALGAEDVAAVLDWAIEQHASCRDLSAHIKALKPGGGLAEEDWEPAEQVWLTANHRWHAEMPEEQVSQRYVIAED